MEEIEVKFLNIDPQAMEQKFVELGAKKVFDRIFKSRVFDYPDLRLNSQAAWIRLRDEGDKITLSFKQRQGAQGDGGQTNDTGMTEHEVTVSDFEATSNIFFGAGFIQKFYEEKRRIRYMLGDVELDIDYVPLLDPYLEIEADDWAKIDKTIEVLGLDTKDKKIFSAFQVYQLAGINQLDYSELTLNGVTKRA
jgi:adenylate cyclase, class 2